MHRAQTLTIVCQNITQSDSWWSLPSGSMHELDWKTGDQFEDMTSVIWPRPMDAGNVTMMNWYFLYHFHWLVIWTDNSYAGKHY